MTSTPTIILKTTSIEILFIISKKKNYFTANYKDM